VRSIERQNCFVSGISQLARGALEERVAHRDYGWSGGGFARLWLRRAGGERGDFTARTKAITRLVGTPRPLNASAATNRSSETKATSVTVAIHGTQAIPTNDTTAAAPSFFPMVPPRP